MLDFQTAIQELGPGAIFRFANSARVPSEYLLNTILPERLEPSYSIESGNILVRSTMASVVGMDSPYPPGGIVELTTLKEQTLKLANAVTIPEATIRRMQSFVRDRLNSTAASKEALAAEVLNFFDKVILQGHMDFMEWARGQALSLGALTFTQNGIAIDVDYNIPAGNLQATRTTTAAYNGSASVFWADILAMRQALKTVSAIVMNSATFYAILNNSVNAINVLSETDSRFEIVKVVGTSERPSTDARNRIAVTIYDREADLYNGTTNARQAVKFVPDGKIICIGRSSDSSGYRPGQGSTPDPDANQALGYTHIAPTVEGGGVPGRWGRVFTPQDHPWSLSGQGVSNGLPVIENVNSLYVMSTTIS